MDAVDLMLSHPVMVSVGWALVHFVWQGLAAALALAVVLLLLRGRSSNGRYVVSCGALLVMAMLPVATFWSLCASPSPESRAIPASMTVAGSPASEQAVGSRIEQGAALDTAGGVSGPRAALPWRSSISGFFEPTLPWLALGWFLGVIAMSLRFLGGWIQAERLKHRHVKLVGEEWHARLARIAQRVGVRRPVRLLDSGLVNAPVLIGWLRPVILLPVAALIGLSQGELEAIIAHELAHVRRCDYLVRLLQTLVENLLFYHPAVWWISRQISIEREYCCDDLAAVACGDKLRYARALTGLAQLRGLAPQLAVAADGGSLLARIRRLLSGTSDRPRYAGWWPGGVIAVAVVVALIGTTFHLSVFAAQENGQTVAAVGPEQNVPDTVPADAGPPAIGAEVTDAVPTPPVTPPSGRMGVALLEFSRVGSQEGLGQVSAEMYELVAERLASAPSVRLVERAKLEQTMKELKLSQTGLVDPATATQIGRILGARIFVAGKLMKLGGDWVVTARLIDTETTEVSALRVTAMESEGVLALADMTGDAIVARLAKVAGGRAVASEDSPLAEEIEALRVQLARRKLPVVAVCVPESHIGTWVPDPAGENEIIAVLSQVGFRVVDISTLMKREPPTWWLTLFHGRAQEGEGTEWRLNQGFRSVADIMHDKRIEKIKERVQLFVIGEAFSEYAGENYGFRSCRARIEVKAVHTETETVAAAASQHAVAADIGELLAGKKALRAAGGQLGLDLARRLAEYWEKATKAPDTAKANAT